MIACPTCGAESRVTETRRVGTPSRQARRRRVCESVSCGQKFTTVELVVTSNARPGVPGRPAIDASVVRGRDLRTLRAVVDELCGRATVIPVSDTRSPPEPDDQINAQPDAVPQEHHDGHAAE